MNYMVQNSYFLPANAGDAGDMSLIPGLRRSPGGGNGNSLQFSCLKNPSGRRSVGITVPAVAKSQTRLSDLARTHKFLCTWASM